MTTWKWSPNRAGLIECFVRICRRLDPFWRYVWNVDIVCLTNFELFVLFTDSFRERDFRVDEIPWRMCFCGYWPTSTLVRSFFLNNFQTFDTLLVKIVSKVCPVVAHTEVELTDLLSRTSRAWRYVLNDFRVKRNRLGANCAKEFSVRFIVFVLFFVIQHPRKSADIWSFDKGRFIEEACIWGRIHSITPWGQRRISNWVPGLGFDVPVRHISMQGVGRSYAF